VKRQQSDKLRLFMWTVILKGNTVLVSADGLRSLRCNSKNCLSIGGFRVFTFFFPCDSTTGVMSELDYLQIRIKLLVMLLNFVLISYPTCLVHVCLYDMLANAKYSNKMFVCLLYSRFD